ncbi:MAG TPA: hypothetical protein VIK97_16045 [Casimicrobiaceae bacterium]
MIGGPAARPPGEIFREPPEPRDDEAQRQLYSAHRRRRHTDLPTLVAFIAIVGVFVGLTVWFAIHLL